MNDSDMFNVAIDTVMNNNKERTSIGLLGEKTLHSVIKHYLSPDTSKHEIKVGSFYADICDGCEHIFEIQTRSFNLLRKKLEYFLPMGYDVTVVYPIPNKKWLMWLDPQTGEVSNKRLSPKKGSIYDIIKELYKIKMFLRYNNLSFRIMFIDCEELRLKDGYARGGKKGSHRIERIPVSLVNEVEFGGKLGYNLFLPDDIKKEFTSSDASKLLGIRRDRASTLLNILCAVGEISLIGKQGRCNLYSKISE